MVDRNTTTGPYSVVLAEKDLEAIVAEHESSLLRYATRLVNSPEAAQDVVQEAFIKLCRNWNQAIALDGHVSQWLYRTTHNAAIDYIRRESRLHNLHQSQADEVPDSVAPTAGHALEEQDKKTLVLKYLHKLDPAEQQVVLLRLQEGLSYQEISQITQRTEGNVGCILHNAVKKLAQSLKRAGVTT